MKNLVISVSPDSSLELLRPYADIIILDKNIGDIGTSAYDTVYIRSHFSQPSTLPQKFRHEISDLVNQVTAVNPNVLFIDGMSTVDAIVTFEDKWQQYTIFGKYMPRTELYEERNDLSSFTRPVFKNRLSSRGTGVTWNREEASSSTGDWIVQESLDIAEELRIYIINGEVYPTGVVRQNKTEDRIVKAKASRRLTQEEIDFSLSLAQLAPDLNIIGIDVACTSSGELSLIEVNRSPGFAKFYEFSGVNLADLIYKS